MEVNRMFIGYATGVFVGLTIMVFSSFKVIIILNKAKSASDDEYFNFYYKEIVKFVKLGMVGLTIETISQLVMINRG
jgi:hypothetical protein